MRGCDERNTCVPEIGPRNRCLSPAFPVQAVIRSYDSVLAPSGLKRTLLRTLSSWFRAWLGGKHAAAMGGVIPLHPDDLLLFFRSFLMQLPLDLGGLLKG